MCSNSNYPSYPVSSTNKIARRRHSSYEGHYTFRGNQRKGKISARESLFEDKNQWRAPPASSNPGEEYICKLCGAVNKMLVARITARAVLLSKSYLWARTVCAVE